MNFQKIRNIEKPEIYIKKAFNQSRKGKKIRAHDKNKRKKLEELQKIKLYKDVIYDDLQKIIKGFPDFNELSPFYKELINDQIDLDRLKVEISKISWIKQKLIQMFKDYFNRIKATYSLIKIKRIQKEFYGRTSSLLNKSNKTFEFLEKSRKKMRNFPSIKTKIKTICITGFPNVGKSTLLKKLTGSNVKIQPYAFTTKELLVGYIGKKLQLIDTPGSLNRYNKMNNIEKQAYIALKYLAHDIIFVFDLTESCGYEMKEQLKLYNKIKKEFKDKQIIIYLSKADLISNNKINEFINKFDKNCNIYYNNIKLKNYILPPDTLVSNGEK